MVKGKILVIDDEPSLCNLMKVILEETGFQVTTVLNPLKALELVTSIKPDLVILDVVMPEMNGWEVCSKLKNTPGISHIPVMFLTVSADSSDVEKGFGSGGDSYMCKPFRPQELVDRVFRILKIKK